MSATLFDERGLDPDRDRPAEGDAGYALASAPIDAWRDYDVDHPDPPYFQFDTLSARHPDLYDRFALSTDGAMEELRSLIDLSGLTVCDVGAGTGRSARAAAAIAKEVIAVDRYEGAFRFGEARMREAGIANVTYRLGDRANLPLADNSVDAVIASFAGLDEVEALRVVRPGGWIIKITAPLPEAAAGELTAVLAEAYPAFGQAIAAPAPEEWFREGCPATDSVVSLAEPLAAKVVDGVRHVHDFTYIGRFESSEELAAIAGRFYGPAVARYITQRNQSSLGWRVRIEYVQIAR